MIFEEEEEESAKLFRELTEYDKKGIICRLSGWRASPMQIALSPDILKEGAYMRDYVFNDQGDIEEVHFNIVKL